MADFLFPLPAFANIAAFLLAFFLFLYYILQRKTCNHPLPPQAAGAWPLIGHVRLLGGPKPLHITLGDMADNYGPIFTLNLGVHRALIVSSSEIAKECLTTNDRVFANRPKSMAMELLGYNFAMIGLNQYGPYWRQIRKMATVELLSSHRLEMLKIVRTSEVKSCMNELYKLWMLNKNSSNKVLVDMKSWFGDLTSNIIFRMIVGKRLVDYNSSREDEDYKRVNEVVREMSDLIGKVPVSDILPFLRWLDLGGVEKAMKKTRQKLDDVIQGWLEEHKQKKISGEGKGEQDMMDVMLSVLDDDGEFPADTINKATCLGLILAGSDTTFITLIWAISLLVNNKVVLKKAQQELDTHVGRERKVQESDTKNLVYLQAIIKETLRLYPAVPVTIPHESTEDCTTGGYHVPARTRILINLYKIHRDPKVWPDPYEFKPERFLTTHKDIDVKGQNFELIPFGSGRRMCPGLSLALLSLQLTLATFLHQFEFGTQSDELVDMVESGGLTNIRASPLEVLITPRLPTHLYN